MYEYIFIYMGIYIELLYISDGCYLLLHIISVLDY